MATDQSDQEIAPEQVAELVSAGEAQVVDVRTPEEYAAGHLAGAEHIPFDELAARAKDLDRSRSVVLYCRSGSRSALATQAFAASGWQAYSMSGGLVEWADRGLPLEPQDGEVASMSGLPETPASN
jgi:rhodanese-related sulfurtransferase